MDPNENGAMAKDGAPSPQPPAKGSGKKAKKAKAKAEPATASAAAAENANPADGVPSNPKVKAKEDKPTAAAPPSTKKPKAEKKVDGAGQGQPQGQGQGEGQAEGEAAAVAPQKSKAELKAERRAKQEAQRAAKAGNKPAGAPSQGATAAKTEAPRVSSKVLRDDPGQQRKEEKKLAKQRVPQRSGALKRVALFNHLPQYHPDQQHLSTLTVWNNLTGEEEGCIHPAVSTLGLQYADYTLIGSNARAVGLLAAFQEVVWDYKTPADKDMCRALETHITRLITFLDQCRPMSISMGNAIKFIKQKIITLSENHNDLSDAEAKKELIVSMKKFVKQKICKAGQAISLYAQSIIRSSKVIIVYGYSSVIYKALRRADNKSALTVLVVDSRPRHEGQKMLKALCSLGIQCIFVPLEQAAFYMRNIDQPSGCAVQKLRLFVGAHGVLNNAHVMSRIGTATLTSIARALNIPVYVCFETYKISERAQTDAIVFNELGDANELETIGARAPILKDWKEQRTLGLLNLMYDVAPNSHFSTFITEIGLIPDTSIPKVSPLNMDSRSTAVEDIEIGPDCVLMRRQCGLA